MCTKLRFVQTSDECGDCTASYVVEIKTQNMTIKEFLDIILKEMSSDWGEIKFYLGSMMYYDIKLRYRHGEIETNQEMYEKLLEDLGDKTINRITSDGGWTRMDYVVVLK